MDTVEWGSVEPAQRRLPAHLSIPRVGGLVLAAIGFVLLVTAELNPWARAHTEGGGDGRPASQLSITMDLAAPGGAIAYHLGALVLLGTVGLVLASPARWRRPLLGLAAGLAAGQLLVVVEIVRTIRRTVEAGGAGQSPSADTVLTTLQVSYSAGAYLAVAGVLTLAGACVLTALRWPDLAAPVLVGAPPEPDADRELTVTALEPSDASHYARE